MIKPTLTVIAGCNGSGKSSFSKALTSEKTPSFDYDKVYLEKYNVLHDSDIREVMAHNKARQVLEESIEHSLQNKVDFTFETNFNSTPLYWPKKFKEANFNLRLIYFCLNSIEEAKRRVQIRVENGGHFVPENEIIERYQLGYKHLNEHYRYFNEVYLFDTSTYKERPQFLFTIKNGEIQDFKSIPLYLEKLIPNIIKS